MINWKALAVLIIGVGVAIDGLGSVLIGGGQYHNMFFDSERYVRTAAGIILIIVALIELKGKK